jgi:hypothetical protein
MGVMIEELELTDGSSDKFWRLVEDDHGRWSACFWGRRGTAGQGQLGDPAELRERVWAKLDKGYATVSRRSSEFSPSEVSLSAIAAFVDQLPVTELRACPQAPPVLFVLERWDDTVATRTWLRSLEDLGGFTAHGMRALVLPHSAFTTLRRHWGPWYSTAELDDTTLTHEVLEVLLGLVASGMHLDEALDAARMLAH